MTRFKLSSLFRKTEPARLPDPPKVDLTPLTAQVTEWVQSIQTAWDRKSTQLDEFAKLQRSQLDAALERLEQAERRLKSAASTQGSAEPLALSTAFIQGFQFAMSEGGQLLRQEAINRGTDIALERLDSVVMERAEALGHTAPRSVLELQKKMTEFTQRASHPTTSPSDKLKYQYYLDALDWALYANPVSTNKK